MNDSRIDHKRQSAIAWARNILKINPVFLDTETTGLDGDAQVVEVAVVDSAGHLVFESLVRPTVPIPPDATAVHGITDEMVANAPTFAEVYPALIAAIDGRPLVIYNANYDLRLLDQSRRAAGISSLSVAIGAYDAMANYAAYYGDWSSHHGNFRRQQLGRAGHQCHIELPPDLHRARADAELCRLIVHHMAECQKGEDTTI